MVHYRQGTFHCYILSCVVSGDKRTTILISIRRINTWLEPMKSALSFCHWLRPSGPNKVFLFESTAVGNYMGNAPCLYIRVVFFFFLCALFKTNNVCFMVLVQCQIWSVLKEERKIKHGFLNAPVSFHFLLCAFLLLCIFFLFDPACSLWW